MPYVVGETVLQSTEVAVDVLSGGFLSRSWGVN
jgi:hypothetical protein